jgi:hypothetical protein
VLGLLISIWLSHPLVVVDGEGTCPAPADVEARLGALLPQVEEREPQHRAVLEHSAAGLQVDLLRDDGERLAQRVLDARGSCADLAAATAVVIAAWEARLNPEIAARMKLPPDAEKPVPKPEDRPAPKPELKTAGAAPPPPAFVGLEGGIGVTASIAGSDLAPGLTIHGALMSPSDRFGATMSLSGAGRRDQVLDNANGATAGWMRGVLALGAQARLHGFAQLVFDLHGDALLGLLRVAGASGTSSTDPLATWSSQSDIGVQVGAGAGVRVMRAWGPLGLWLGLGGRAWPGHQRLVVEGQPQATGEVPRYEGELALGVAWRRLP